jgi:BON domain
MMQRWTEVMRQPTDISTTRLAVTGMALTAAALTVSCATTPPPPVPGATQQAAQAAAVEQKHAAQDVVAEYITAQLNADPTYFYRHVSVQVDDDGVAHLSGYVWDTSAIYRARRIASGVPGVTGVVTNGLELERNGPNTGPAR